MLIELAVRDLGVIAELRLGFGPGMSALTGETGAGKTMIVEAIGLLLGGKPDPARVRAGADEAIVEGLFVTPAPDGEGEIETVLRRVIPTEGRSRSYVNGQLAPASQLAELGAGLIELHGQHAQQALLRPRTIRDALDRFGGIDTAPLTAASETVRDLEAELAELGGDERERARELDLLRYQLAELDAARITDAGEDVDLESAEDVLADAVAHREAGSAALDSLDGDGGAAEGLARAAHALDRRTPFAELHQRLDGLVAEAADVAHELRAATERIEEDPARLAELRARRQLLVELRRKYGDTLADVIAYRDEVAGRIETLSTVETRALAVGDLVARARHERHLVAAAVGTARRAAAPLLAERLREVLGTVALAHAVVEVVVADDGGLPAGEQVSLLVSMNPGLAPQPLTKVASGGELSRTMLALHLVLSAGPPTMVFDEVDAGVGGATATSIGRALAGLATGHQVLVVTHLPQVAAYADAQLAVTKEIVEGGRNRRATTSTTIRHLEPDDRVIELSRMLSGSPESSTAQEHAVELLTSAAGDRVRSAAR